MTIEQQPKAAVHVVKILSDAGASAALVRSEDSNTEVIAHALRRRFHQVPGPRPVQLFS